MKLVIILLAVVLFFFASFKMFNKHESYRPSRGEQLVNSTLAKGAKIIKKKYNIRPCGAGAAMPEGPIRELTLCFQTNFPHTKGELRELLIKTAHELLRLVEENSEIQEFLYERPFTIKNIQIIIANHKKDGSSLYDPEISIAQIARGILDYSAIDPQDVFQYKNEFEESYEEARQILGMSNS